jgi:opacity protein-like surface antigen
MRRIKVILAVVAAVATMTVLATPAMAQSEFSQTGGTGFFNVGTDGNDFSGISPGGVSFDSGNGFDLLDGDGVDFGTDGLISGGTDGGTFIGGTGGSFF